MAPKKILILNDISLNSANSISIVKLKHPKLNELVSFVLVENGPSTDLYELMSYSQEMGSLFIDDYVQSECCINIGNRFNLKYFLIEFLYQKSKAEFKSLDEFKLKFLESIISDKLEKEQKDLVIKKLKELDFSNLNSLFDVEDEKKSFIIKFNSSKCMDWLKKKADLLKTYMENSSSSDTNLIKQKQQNASDKESKLKLDAFELLAQYFNKDIAELLRKELHLNSPLDSNSNTNKKAKQQIEVID